MNSRTASSSDCDLVIAGAGLAGGLIAMAVAARRPDIRLVLIDGADQAGGNHVWSWFDSDIGPDGHDLLAPVTAHRWPDGYEVRFPSYTRRIATGYNSMTSDRLDTHLRALLGDRLMLGAGVKRLRPDMVELADGRSIKARGVIDARGLRSSHNGGSRGTNSDKVHSLSRDPTGCPQRGQSVADPASSDAGSFLEGGMTSPIFSCGWQKFLGQTLLLARPHHLDCPIVMDATVNQRDGYRFVYVLPIAPQLIFVEDTYYADESPIGIPLLSGRIESYARQQGWAVETVLHQETGAIPVVKSGDFEAFWPEDDPVARAGTRAGLFHPTTGYSLPMAVDFALALAGDADLDGAALARRTRAVAAAHWRAGTYYRLLDRMLFDAAAPGERHRIFERFYRLPAPLIGRFYAHRSTYFDKMRILCGKPPVRIRAALAALAGRKGA